MWELFPDARFVLLVRHGLDVAYSLAERRYRFAALDRHLAATKGDLPVAAARFWSAQNDKMEAFRLAHPESCMRVRYEDLTAHPEPTLRKVFAFVGEAWEPAVVEFNRFPHDTGHEDPIVRWRDRIETNSGKWSAWPNDVVDRAAAACGSTLARLGYEVARPPHSAGKAS